MEIVNTSHCIVFISDFCSQREYVLLPLLDEISAEIFGPEYPRARDLEYRTQLVLVNTHPAVDFPEPLPPNVIPVGGLQIQEPKPLSKVACGSDDSR